MGYSSTSRPNRSVLRWLVFLVLSDIDSQDRYRRSRSDGLFVQLPKNGFRRLIISQSSCTRNVRRFSSRPSKARTSRFPNLRSWSFAKEDPASA